jgi:hypothetical protein
MKLFLHVGLPKTASTAIQSFADVNRERLSESTCVYYPPGDTLTGKQHALISCAFIGPVDGDGRFRGVKVPDKHSAIRQIVSEARKHSCDSVLLSSELFNRATIPATIRKKKNLGGVKEFVMLKEYFDEINVVLVVRRQDEWVESYYNQSVKSPHMKCVMTLDSEINRLENNDRLDFNRQAEAWAKHFGRESLLIIPFEKGQIRETVLHTFFDAVGVNIRENEYVFEKITSNKSISANSAYVFQKLNACNFSISHEQRVQLVRKLINFDSQVGYETQYARLMSYEQAKMLVERYRESNDELAKKYLGRKDGNLFVNQSVFSNGRAEDAQLVTPVDVKKLVEFGVFDGLTSEVVTIFVPPEELPPL